MDLAPGAYLHRRSPAPAERFEVKLVGPAEDAGPAARTLPLAPAEVLHHRLVVQRVVNLLIGFAGRNRNRPCDTVAGHAFVACSRTSAVMKDKVHRARSWM